MPKTFELLCHNVTALMSTKGIYLLALSQLPSEAAALMQQHILAQPAAVLPLDTKAFLFTKEQRLPCLTLWKILGEACITQCHVEGMTLGSAWSEGLETQYTVDGFFSPKLLHWRMGMLFTHLLLMEKLHEQLRAAGLSPLFADHGLSGELGDYSFYGPVLRYMAGLCQLPLAQVPASRLAPLLKTDQPLLPDVDSIRETTLLTVEQGEMPRFQATQRVLEGAHMRVSPLMFPYDGTSYGNDISHTGERVQGVVQRITPPLLALQAEFLGEFSQTYPGVCKHPTVHKAWHMLRHIFYHLHAIYLPWLVRYHKLWTNLLQQAAPPAIITSLVEYPASTLPGLAARKLGIPAFGISHSTFQSVCKAIAPEYALTNYPQSHKHFSSLGMKSYLVKSERPLLNIKRRTCEPIEKFEKKTILILTSIATRFDLIHYGTFDFIGDCLLQLQKMPPSLADFIQIKLKWHPFDGDCGMARFCADRPWLEILPNTAQAEPYLDNAWMVVGLEYMTGGLMQALGRGTPTVFWGVERWKAYTNMRFSLDAQETSWYWQVLTHISKPQQFWPLVQACLDDKAKYEALKSKAVAFQNTLQPAAHASQSLPDIFAAVVGGDKK